MKIFVSIIGILILVVAIAGVYHLNFSETVEVDEGQMHPDITIFSPQPGEMVSSPIEVMGEAKGFWFFEATAPVSIISSEGLIVGEGFIQADGPWMTEDFVPFTGVIEFERGEDDPHRDDTRGVIEFRNHNASGLPEHKDSFEVPVTFE